MVFECYGVYVFELKEVGVRLAELLNRRGSKLRETKMGHEKL